MRFRSLGFNEMPRRLYGGAFMQRQQFTRGKHCREDQHIQVVRKHHGCTSFWKENRRSLVL